MGSTPQRELIDRIRREKFGIGATSSNPLAAMLHEAIGSLSAELYQKDIHFISELLQNAEDNVYGKSVTPSLELILTRIDITGVGAPATLILFNNEVGFQPEHVEALCAVGMSTKKGKRNSGYIGEKGIGFKSVFLVTRTPYVISNGFRFRFTDEASNEAKIGYVLPEWVEKPTDADLRHVYETQELPKTMIILPLRPDKVEPVRKQLSQVAPETLLFLSKLRQVNVRQGSGNNLCVVRSDIAQPSDEISIVNLSLGSTVNQVEACKYLLLQQKFPVTQRVEQRKEVDKWIITVAFPLKNRINPGQLNGDIFAFLPSDLVSGLPFIVNADFLLVSSRETLKFDSPWNIGILSCVPAVFQKAFKFILGDSLVARRQAYRYIPVDPAQHSAFRKVRERILEDLKVDNCVLVDALEGCNLVCKPEKARMIRSDFLRIMNAAKNEGNMNPVIKGLPWHIVDAQLQRDYKKTLTLLGVREMKEQEYVKYVGDKDWILHLSESLYWDVVSFVLDLDHSWEVVPLLKYCKEDGSIALSSVHEATGTRGKRIYMSPSGNANSLISDWTSILKPWVSVMFMPISTVRTLEQKGPNFCPSLYSVVSHLSVKSYLEQLLALMETSNDPKLVILITELMYQCLQAKDIEKMDCYRGYIVIVDQSSKVRRLDRHSNLPTILLPADGSAWTELSLNSWCNDTIVLSNDYVITPPEWPSRWKARISDKADPFVLHSYRSYLEDVFSAKDIPQLVPRDDARFQMPKELRLSMTIDQTFLLLNWLTNCLKERTLNDFGLSRLVQNIKETKWLPTERHGLLRPSSCLMRSSFAAFFRPSDIPCVHPRFDCYSPVLQALGVITSADNGCKAVNRYLLRMSNCKTGKYSCSLEQATRLYMYIHRFPGVNSLTSQKPKIFVPSTTQDTSNLWKDSESCVLQDADKFFGDMLIVLEDLYPSTLLPFFSRVLNVPEQAAVEKYCQMWLKWRADFHKITLGECTHVWKVVSEKWTSCNSTIKSEFIAKAWVPCRSDSTGLFYLSSPTDCFIPDDLHLVSLFAGRPDVHFVWYPNHTEKMESGMNQVYADMQVKNLSLCVDQKLLMGETSRGENCIPIKLEVSEGLLCPGLFRAILGFLARKKYGLESSERQRLLAPLKNVVETIITRPLTTCWTISSLSPPVVATEDNVMALWSRKDGKFYCLGKENPRVLRSPLARRHFRTQVATTLSHGLLSEHPLVAEELTEFLNSLIGSGFEETHVDYELKRKHAKLFEEDEFFLSKLRRA